MYSIIVPMKNEEGNVTALVNEVQAVMEKLGKPWELICIEDGSTDKTLEILGKLAIVKPFLRILVFDRNYGQSSAFDAGFKAAKGDYVITLDGDLQNDPKDIPKLLELAENYDLVCGQRVKRKDTASKRFLSWLGNTVRSRVCDDGIKDTGCSLKVFRRDCLMQIKMYHGMHRFLPALFKIEGFRVATAPVNHRPRVQGATKYNIFNRSFNTIADMWAVYWMRRRALRYKIRNQIP